MSPLDGLKAGLPPGLLLPDRPATAAATAASTVALRFDGWEVRPGTPTIAGEARYSGNPAEHRAIAQAIADLILEPSR
jgi:hypothetical protein